MRPSFFLKAALIVPALGLIALPAQAQLNGDPTFRPAGISWVVEEPLPGDWGFCALYYGVTGPHVGQALTLDVVRVAGGGPGLQVTGGQEFSPVYLMIGERPAYVPFPWGDALLVEVMAAPLLGYYNEIGVLAAPMPTGEPWLAGTTWYLQAFEPLFIDPYPWNLHTSWGLSVAFEADPSAPPSAADQYTAPVTFNAMLEVMESWPLQFAAELEAYVPGEGWILEHVRTDFLKSGGAEVYFTLTEPSPEEATGYKPEVIRSRAYLGEGLECQSVWVYVNHMVAGRYYMVPPEFMFVEELETPCPFDLLR